MKFHPSNRIPYWRGLRIFQGPSAGVPSGIDFDVEVLTVDVQGYESQQVVRLTAEPDYVGEGERINVSAVAVQRIVVDKGEEWVRGYED